MKITKNLLLALLQVPRTPEDDVEKEMRLDLDLITLLIHLEEITQPEENEEMEPFRLSTCASDLASRVRLLCKEFHEVSKDEEEILEATSQGPATAGGGDGGGAG